MRKNLFTLAALLSLTALMFVSCTKLNGTLFGKFTVGVNSDGSPYQVYFSQGNLQYQPSTQTWRFATNQYDYVGDSRIGNVYEDSVKCDNSLISATYTGWIDLFGWGTGDNPTCVSTNTADYNTFVDWGKHAISNGGEQANMWRTLTIDEWRYLLFERDSAFYKYGIGIVNGVRGLIILSDNWKLPKDRTFVPGIPFSDYSVDENWSQNTYTTTEWVGMELNGAVFLPAAGCRSGTEVAGLDTVPPQTWRRDTPRIGYYSSSTSTPPGWHDGCTYTLFFVSNLLRADYDHDVANNYGNSVRLVRPCVEK